MTIHKILVSTPFVCLVLSPPNPAMVPHHKKVSSHQCKGMSALFAPKSGAGGSGGTTGASRHHWSWQRWKHHWSRWQWWKCHWRIDSKLRHLLVAAFMEEGITNNKQRHEHLLDFIAMHLSGDTKCSMRCSIAWAQQI